MKLIPVYLKHADKRYLYINTSQILHVEAEENRTLIILVDGTVCLMNLTLEEFIATFSS